MRDSESVVITFDCEASGHPQWCNIHRGEIEIEIGTAIKDYVGDTAFYSTIRMRAGEYTFEDRMVIYGGGIRFFTVQLQKLYDDLQGSARLYDWDGELLLCFTVSDHARGQIAVGGRLTPGVFDTKSVSEDQFVTNARAGMPGIVIAFDGLNLGQSYLRHSLTDLNRFVSEHSTECRMTGGYPAAPQ